MQQGVEPVQVFRLSQGPPRSGRKERGRHADGDGRRPRLLNGVGNVEHFVLVTGDADFIPVILELKRHGHTVSVIGVTGATNELIQRFVDNFELFEDLLDAANFTARNGDLAATGAEIAPVGEAIRNLLAQRSGPVQDPQAAAAESCSGHAFDPGRSGARRRSTSCGSTPPNWVWSSDRSRTISRSTCRVPRPQSPTAPTDRRWRPSRSRARPSSRPNSPRSNPSSSRRSRARRRRSRTHPPTPPTSWRATRPAPPRWFACPRSRGPYSSGGATPSVPPLTPPTGAPATSIELLPRLNAAAAVAIPALAKHLRLHLPDLAGRASGAPDGGGVYSSPGGNDGPADPVPRTPVHRLCPHLPPEGTRCARRHSPGGAGRGFRTRLRTRRSDGGSGRRPRTTGPRTRTRAPGGATETRTECGGRARTHAHELPEVAQGGWCERHRERGPQDEPRALAGGRTRLRGPDPHPLPTGGRRTRSTGSTPGPAHRSRKGAVHRELPAPGAARRDRALGRGRSDRGRRTDRTQLGRRLGTGTAGTRSSRSRSSCSNCA